MVINFRWKIWWLALILMINVIVAGCVSDSDGTAMESAESDDSSAATKALPEITGAVRVFAITGENYKFVVDGKDNPELKVKLGEKVRIEFTSSQGYHDFVVNEFRAATQKVSAPDFSSVEFVADKKGTFVYYCSVGDHREKGMQGIIVVE